MSNQLAKGVHLHVFPTEKYKTIRIKIKFAAQLQYETITARSFVSNMLETNSQKYPSQTTLRKELSELFGAGFGISSERKGNLSIITAEMSLVNDKFLSLEDHVFEKGMAFLKEILLAPHAENEKFHPATFKREKENLLDLFDSYYDDKQLYASLALQQLYFHNAAQQMPGTGSKEQLEQITPRSLYEEYLRMIKKDRIDIFVLGDISKERVESAFSKFGFEDRELIRLNPFYRQNKEKALRLKEEAQPVQQAKLNLAYQTGIYYLQDDYYAGQVFNGLFGGFPHSKLFLNVREKESLAYYASSSLDTFRGMMMVQTGIDSNQAKKVKEIINTQLDELKNGNLDEGAFDQTKEMLINQLYQSQDSPSATIERAYAMDLAGMPPVTVKEWAENIQKVTIDQIKEVAQDTSLQAEYLLKGEEA